MVKIKLDKERELKGGLNTLCRFEAITGKNALQELEKGKISAIDLRALLWAALDDDSLTLEQVGDFISTQEDMVRVSKAITRALKNPTSAQSG
jgi:hypothetical protein